MVDIDPDVLQSGFELKFLFWSGENLENCRRISQRILPANLSALFLKGFRPSHKNAPPKFTPKIVGTPFQSRFAGPKNVSHRFSACGRDQYIFLKGTQVPATKWPQGTRMKNATKGAQNGQGQTAQKERTQAQESITCRRVLHNLQSCESRTS